MNLVRILFNHKLIKFIKLSISLARSERILYFCSAEVFPWQTYFDESVLAFILEWKSGKFALEQGKQHARHSVLMNQWGVLTPYSQYECGVLFICSIGIPEPPFR
jgi:hypothetical protein